MQINQEQLARQQQGAQIWFDSGKDGILDYATGVGKTYTCSLCIRLIEEISKDSYIVVVPGAELENQWNTKINEYFPKSLTNRIVVKTVHKILEDNLLYEVGMLIIDEIHEFTTEERQKLLNGSIIKSKYFLGLTASGDDKNFHKVTKYHKIVDHISYNEAKEKGFVADFIEYNLGLYLTPAEKEQYDKYSETINKLLPKFENNLDYAQKVMSGGKDHRNNYYSGIGWAYGLAVKKGWNGNLNLSLESHRKIDELWNPSLFVGWAKRLINAIRGRKDLLYNATAKYNTTIELVDKFDKVKTILFSESTTFADRINTALNNRGHKSVVYHSNLKTKMVTSPKSGKLIKYGKIRQQKEALNDIRTGKARILSTATSLDRGLDITDLRFSITTSGTQNPTQTKQRTGRTTRKEAGDSIYANMPVLLVNLYIVDTQDEIWLKRRQENNINTPIVVGSVDEISYTPPPNSEFTVSDL